MIYLTGDCHASFSRFNTYNFPEQAQMTKDDYVIVCGDFGYWTPSPRQDWDMHWLSDKPFTTLFVDGNHECYRTNKDLYLKRKCEFETGLFDLPTEKWHGGLVHKITDSIIHLTRGQVFDIEGLKFFTFGGARSHDISDGILDPDEFEGGSHSKEYKKRHKQLVDRDAIFRIKGMSWWPEEMPSEEEMDVGRRTLENNNWNVDYVISHDGPASAVAMYGAGRFKTDKLNAYLQEIDEKLTYRKWFFGHYHNNINIDDKHILIYEQMIRIH